MPYCSSIIRVMGYGPHVIGYMSLLKSSGFFILKPFVIDKAAESIRLLKIFLCGICVQWSIYSFPVSFEVALCLCEHLGGGWRHQLLNCRVI